MSLAWDRPSPRLGSALVMLDAGILLDAFQRGEEALHSFVALLGHVLNRINEPHHAIAEAHDCEGEADGEEYGAEKVAHGGCGCVQVRAPRRCRGRA